MGLEVPVGAVHRHHVLRLQRADHLRGVVPVAVARGVDRPQVLQGGLGPQPGGIVQHPGDGHLVAGDGPGAEHQAVAVRDLQALHLAPEHPGQAAHLLALGAGAEHQDLLGLEEGHLLGVDEEIVRQLEALQFPGHGDVALHGAPQQADLAALLVGQVQQGLDAVDVGAEGGHEQLALGLLEGVPQALPADGLGGRAARPQDVGGIREQHRDARLAQVLQALQCP